MLLGIAEIHHRAAGGRGKHRALDAADEIVDVTEAARLRAIAVDGQRLAAQRLGHEIRDQAPILRVTARTVRVEDAHDSGVEAVGAPVDRSQRLAEALALVIAGAWPERVDVAPVRLALRMLEGIAVNLRRRRE